MNENYWLRLVEIILFEADMGFCNIHGTFVSFMHTRGTQLMEPRMDSDVCSTWVKLVIIITKSDIWLSPRCLLNSLFLDLLPQTCV